MNDLMNEITELFSDTEKTGMDIYSNEKKKPGKNNTTINMNDLMGGLNMNDLMNNEIAELFSDVEMNSNEKKTLIDSISLKIEKAVSLSTLQEKLKVLYEYEKNYLELIKEYKEEIKFAATLQEDLRKERTKFFSEALKEVSATLKESQVDSNVASVWIKELVDSYTKSLDLSSGLIEEHTIDTIGEIRQKAKKEAKEVKEKNE